MWTAVEVYFNFCRTNINNQPSLQSEISLLIWFISLSLLPWFPSCFHPVTAQFLSQMCLEIHTDLANCLGQGKTVVLHSRKSWGRAPTVVATYLLRVHPELQPDVAIEHVRKCCGRHAVQTVKQYNHIHEYHEYQRSSTTALGRASPVHVQKSWFVGFCTAKWFLYNYGQNSKVMGRCLYIIT